MSFNNNINHATSRDYEFLIRNLIEQEMSGISGVDSLEVLHNVKMKGLSGYRHQIDVAYRFRLWKTEILVIVECKQYQKNVGVDDLLEFRSRIEDLRAHKEIFVTSSDFQSGAVEFAQANRIALLIVRGTQSEDVLYQSEYISPNELCKRQVEELRDIYQTTKTGLDSRVSINHRKHAVVVSHKRVRVSIEPGEFQHAVADRLVCEFENADSDDEVFFKHSKFSYLRTDKVLKSLILDELLTLRSDG
jgi:hypothetical protein